MSTAAGPGGPIVIDAPRMANGQISPKAKMAALAVAIATVVGVAAHTLATGEFNATEIGEAVTGLVGAVLAFVGAYSAKPGPVVPEVGSATGNTGSGGAI